MRKKKKAEEHVNHERWVVSYADFITLLFAFFVVLYAISQVDAKKMSHLITSMQSAFNTKVFPSGSARLSLQTGGGTPPDPHVLDLDTYPTKRLIDPKMAEIERSIVLTIGDDELKDKVQIIEEERGLVVRLAETGFFDPGKAMFKPRSEALLLKIGESLRNIPNQVRIEGHTDNTPINTPEFPSNWVLSTARATSILNLFINKIGMDQERLAIAGYGEFRPIDSNSTVEGRSRNRRVDIVVLNIDAGAKENPRLKSADIQLQPAKIPDPPKKTSN